MAVESRSVGVGPHGAPLELGARSYATCYGLSRAARRAASGLAFIRRSRFSLLSCTACAHGRLLAATCAVRRARARLGRLLRPAAARCGGCRCGAGEGAGGTSFVVPTTDDCETGCWCKW
jgi:hypothetical protein